MQKTWLVQQLPEKSEVIRLQEELKVPQLISQLLLQRGITTFDAARSFFRPDLSDLHDPFLMKDMKEAVERLEKVKTNKEKILVFGDYDVDGTTAVALMSLFLKHTDFIFEYYIPDRYKEGYGISMDGIDYAKQQNCKLIIALDCGITAVDKVDYAKELGIDFIICDHHLPGDELPAAVAILDPKRLDCPYPFKELAGCGIGF
ncbi:MAG: DHH family phosphoesterase, partial [Crocinitomicaceae bacterium]